MSRYRGPKLKISRRLGLLPGLTTKKSNKLNITLSVTFQLSFSGDSVNFHFPER